MDDVSTKSIDYSAQLQGYHNLTGFQDAFDYMQNGTNPNHLLLASQIIPKVISETNVNSLTNIITDDEVRAFMCGKKETTVTDETFQKQCTIDFSNSMNDFVKHVSPSICNFQPQLDSVSVLAAATANISSNFSKTHTTDITSQEDTSDVTVYCTDNDNFNLLNSSEHYDIKCANFVERNISGASIDLHLTDSTRNDCVNSCTFHTKHSFAASTENVCKASHDIGPFLYAPRMAHFQCDIPLSVEISPPSARSDYVIESSPISLQKYEFLSTNSASPCQQSSFMPFVEDGLSSCGSAGESLANSPQIANNVLSILSHNARESSVCSSDSGLLSNSLVRDITDDIREIKRAIVDNADLPPILSRYVSNGSSSWSPLVNGNSALLGQRLTNSDSLSCGSSGDSVLIQQDSPERTNNARRDLAPRCEHVSSVLMACQTSSNDERISALGQTLPLLSPSSKQQDVSHCGGHLTKMSTTNSEKSIKSSRAERLSTQSSSEEEMDGANQHDWTMQSNKSFLSRLSRAKYNRLPDHEITPPPTSPTVAAAQPPPTTTTTTTNCKASLQQRFSKAFQSRTVSAGYTTTATARRGKNSLDRNNAGSCVAATTAALNDSGLRSLDGDFASDEDTEKLLTKQYGTTGCLTNVVDDARLNSVSVGAKTCNNRSGVVGAPHLDIPELQRECEQIASRRRGKEVAVRHPDEPTVLIEGVIFRAAYLGSTQLVSEGQPNKATRMLQAQEAVGRIKAPDGENQPSVDVDLFISTEKMMVLNTNLQEIMMDHSLKSISYIADIGDVLIVMARRRYLASVASVNNSPEMSDKSATSTRQAQIVCHVFESDEASLIAQSIGNAFKVAYMEFLRANGIEDPSVQLKNMDYQDVLNQQEIFSHELSLFSDKQMQKEVIVPKLRHEALGVVIVESGWGSMIPTVVLANMHPTGPAARCGQLNIGDQIICVNCVSCVGLPLVQCQNLLKNCRQKTAVKLTIVSCPPVVEVLIKRPDAKYQLGFSVQNGVICSLLRGGIAERGGVRVGHRIIEINGQSMVAVSHERIVNILAGGIGEIHMKTMPTSIFRLLTGQEVPHYI